MSPLRQRWDSWWPKNPPVAGWVTVTRRRVYILPTPFGLGFALMLAFMLSGAVNFNLSIGHALVYWLISLGCVSALHANMSLIGVRLSLLPVEPVFAGETAYFRLRAETTDGRARHGLELRGSASEVARFAIASGQTLVELPWNTQQRGWLPCGRLTLFTRYPLGLLRAWSYIGLEGAVLVYPAPETDAPLPTVMAHLNSNGLADRPGEDDFSGLRDWQASDPPRRIAWRQSARHDHLLTRLNTDPVGEQLWLDWQALPANLGVEQKLSRLTRWLLSAENAGLHYGLRMPNLAIDPACGREHLHRCLRILAEYETVPTPAR